LLRTPLTRGLVVRTSALQKPGPQQQNRLRVARQAAVSGALGSLAAAMLLVRPHDYAPASCLCLYPTHLNCQALRLLPRGTARTRTV
jgi:hypothetical protein